MADMTTLYKTGRIPHRDIREVLDALGISVEREGVSDFYARCPFHEDKDPSFAVQRETGMWICYAGCGGGSLIALVSQVLNVDRKDAVGWLRACYNPQVTGETVLDKLDGQQVSKPSVAAENLIYDASGTYGYMLNRGFTVETLKAWKIGRDLDREAVVIPVYFQESLQGLIYRNLLPGTRKYENTEHLPKDSLLFGWDMANLSQRHVIVVEGPLDAMWLWQHKYSAVATLGGPLSNNQASLLLQKFTKVVCAFDNDDAGVRATKKTIKLLAGRATVEVAVLPSSVKDVQECNALTLAVVFGQTVPAMFWS